MGPTTYPCHVTLTSHRRDGLQCADSVHRHGEAAFAPGCVCRSDRDFHDNSHRKRSGLFLLADRPLL